MGAAGPPCAFLLLLCGSAANDNSGRGEWPGDGVAGTRGHSRQAGVHADCRQQRQEDTGFRGAAGSSVRFCLLEARVDG